MEAFPTGAFPSSGKLSPQFSGADRRVRLATGREEERSTSENSLAVRPPKKKQKEKNTSKIKGLYLQKAGERKTCSVFIRTPGNIVVICI